MTPKQKRHIIASAGTILFMLLVLLLLLLIHLRYQQEEQEAGIEVLFGDTDRITGVESSQAAPQASVAEVTPAPQTPAEQPEPIVQQPQEQQTEKVVDEDEELAIQNEKHKQDSIDAAKKRAQELAEQRERERKAEEAKKEAERKAKEEADRKAKEEAERKAKEAAEKAKKEQEAKNNANSLIGGLGFGNGSGSGNGTGNGGGGDDSNTSGGKPGGGKTGGGSGGGGGNNRDSRIKGLDGRWPRDGKLPDPECTTNQPCDVAVKIRIDKNGNVKVASSANATGTTTADVNLIHCIEEMLKKVMWNEGTGDGEGTITYHFVQQTQ